MIVWRWMLVGKMRGVMAILLDGLVSSTCWVLGLVLFLQMLKRVLECVS